MIKGLRILLIYSGDEAHEMARKMKQTIINSNDPIIVTIVVFVIFSFFLIKLTTTIRTF